MSKITIVIPVYNVEAYLCRCLESVLGQTYGDFDAVLIDDGSTDKSGEICDRYARSDSRFHVIHQSNGGLSAARNTGIEWALKNSDSEWISFIDSDDWIHGRYLELLLKAVTDYKVRVSSCPYLRTDGEPLPDFSECDITLYDVDQYFLRHNTNATVAWGKLYKKEIFKTVRYPVGKAHEDEFVTYKILFELNQVAVPEQPLYAYYRNETGIMLRKWSPKRFDQLEAIEGQAAFFMQRSETMIAKDRFWALIYFYETYQKEVKESKQLSKYEKTKYILMLKHRMRKTLIRYRKMEWVSFKKPGRSKAIYENAFPEIKAARSIWRKVKAAGKKVLRR